MAQNRYINFGDTVLAQRINEISTAIVVPAVLSGATMTVGLGGKSVDISPHKVMLDSLLLTENNTVTLFVPTPPALALPVDPTDYTVVYEHDNQQIQGGVPATLLVREGLIGFDSIPNTTIVGWIRWTGAGTELQKEMFIEAPKLQITNPSDFLSDSIVPPFVPNIFVLSESPDPGATVVTDVFDVANFNTGGTDAIGSLHMLLDNTSASINTITHIFPFVAGVTPPNKIIIEANVPLGGSIAVSLLDEENTEYSVLGSAITNTASQYVQQEFQVLNVDTDKFGQNRPYYVKVITQLNPAKQARISVLGTSSNFLPI